ncbi:uncharacterized protein LMH87_008438 [Akanthomyces muscarius]|uniref:Peptidase S41 family protein n=1 Tax=Akanthomyces muscarius TaxID=2231603 RepID=A0A9W8UR08_AKAMU|nr:uncharacterized protein LMH87_008438 [Akanthomyces muscarius]KAJ4159540.1 hypothetical protein LMH87_008438 [Akanthomyces muscarius]
MAPHPKLMKQAVKAPPYFSASDFQAAADADPCAMISKAFEAAPRQKNATGPIILDLPPSVGTACLKSVPVAPGPDVDLLDYLGPYIEYQSTLELLQDPPEEYLLPGVDIIGGMKAMKQKLKSNGYETQYDFMMDLQSLFVAANDNHFGYTPGLLSAFRQAREAFDFVSISKDGLEMPQVYASQDIFTAGNLSYTPSPIDTIDGQDVFEFLENDALRNPQGAQDPDARLNSVFRSVPAAAAGIPSGAQTTVFEIPDNYTIVHKNGTSRMVKTSIITLPTIDLCEIRSGEDFQQRFEVPPRKQPTPSQPPEKKRPQSSPPPEPTLPGYPVPLVKHSNSNVASYALNDTELSNTTVISFLSFVALNVEDPLSQDFDLNSFVREFGDVMDRTAKAAKDQGRGKLIIDMSANGGGSLDLADFAYTAFFPGAPFDAFDRYRLNGGLELTGKFLSFNESLQVLVGPAGLPFGADNQTIDDPNAFFEAPPVKNQKLTAAFHRDTSVPYLDRPDVFLRGYESEQKMGDKKREAPWSPEDIVILTDGQCASACTIFTGLMVRNFGIRTIALGGRPLNKPMQAIGGVRGSQLSTNAENKGLITDFVQAASRNRDGQDVLSQVERPIPKIQDPPVLPFMEDPANGGSVNSRNAYSGDDVDGFPLHFKNTAANPGKWRREAVAHSDSVSHGDTFSISILQVPESGSRVQKQHYKGQVWEPEMKTRPRSGGKD